MVRTRDILRTLCLALALGAASATPLAAAPVTTVDAVPEAPTPKLAWVGRVLAPVTARAAPRMSGTPRMVVQPIAPFAQGATSLLITRSVVRDDVRWVEVLLPKRPNGTRGWVPEDVLAVSRTRIRVAIDLSDRKLRVFRAGRRVMSASIAIGKPGTPTPTGSHFAIAERVATNMPGGFLGPYVLPLTGFSETLNEFAGGDGRVAIHGTSLPGLIGTRASHGCMRMHIPDVEALYEQVTIGMKISIRP